VARQPPSAALQTPERRQDDEEEEGREKSEGCLVVLEQAVNEFAKKAI